MSNTTAAASGTGPGDDELVAMVKADLHVHLVGSAAPRTVAALAARHRRARDHLGLTAGQIHALARASIDESFAPAVLKQRLLRPYASCRAEG